MSTPSAGIPDADWLSWPTGARQLILAQQQEIQALRRENEELLNQLTALATELASQRERIGRSSRNFSKPPSSACPCHRFAEALRATSRQNGARAVAASAAASRASPDPGRSCCRSSEWMRWWSTTPIPVALRDVAGWRGSRPIAPSGNRDSANHAGGDRTPAAPAGVPLLFHQHLRHVAGRCGSQSIRTQAFLDQLLGVEISRGARSQQSASD